MSSGILWLAAAMPIGMLLQLYSCKTIQTVCYKNDENIIR